MGLEVSSARAAAVLLLGWPLAAQASTPTMRIVVRSVTPLDAMVLDRLEGQASDLDVAFVVAEGEPGPLHAQAQQAADLTTAHDATATLWFAEVPGRYLVFTSPSGGEQVLLARVETSETGMLSSSGLETAALVLRTALQALLMGEPVTAVEPARDEIAAPPPPAPEPDPEPALDAVVAPRPSATDAEAPSSRSSAATRTWPMHVFVGGQHIADGSGAAGRLGVLMQLAVTLGDIEVGAAGAMSLANAERDPLGELRIARHDALGTLAWRFGTSEHQLKVGTHGGVALFHRRTQADSDRLASAESGLTPAMVVGPTVGWAWMGTTVGFGVQAALDVMPSPPRFEYAGDGAPNEPAYKPSAVAPRIALGMQARLM